MAEWAAKRFWQTAHVRQEDGGAVVLLDTRQVRTPAGAPLRLPTLDLAAAIAAEWDAQGEKIVPGTMPLTRTANSAIDTVAAHHATVAGDLASYGEADLLSYRADKPAELAAQQAALWDPLIEWSAERHGGRLAVTRGVMPIAQEAATLDNLARPIREMDPFHLAGFHDLVVLTGSLVLAHAAAQGARAPQDIWDLSRLDETWQADQWGRDDEAEAAAATRRAAFLDAHRFYVLSGSDR